MPRTAQAHADHRQAAEQLLTSQSLGFGAEARRRRWGTRDRCCDAGDFPGGRRPSQALRANDESVVISRKHRERRPAGYRDECHVGHGAPGIPAG